MPPRAASLFLAVALVALGPACTPDLVLQIDLRTDLVPGRDFTTVRTELAATAPGYDTPVALQQSSHRAVRGMSYFTGTRIASFAHAMHGDAWVRVTLLDAHAAEVASRIVVFRLTGDYAHTVIITSDCRGVVCPHAGDDPSETTCHGGTCVDPHCTSADPAMCPPPECTGTGATCPMPPACAVAQCVDSVCLYDAHDDRCAPDEACDVALGCQLVACGDGIVAGAETCDDGNTLAGDGCDDNCATEIGYACSGAPSRCSDIAPDPFSFTDVFGVAPSAVVTSDEVTLTGFDGDLPATVTGDPSAVILVGGVAAGASTTVHVGDVVSLRVTASTAAATTVAVELAVGDTTAPWNVTTYGGSCVPTLTAVTVAGMSTYTVPMGCGHVSVRAWGGGGGGGPATCGYRPGGPGGTSGVQRGGAWVVAAGGGGGGTAHHPGASSAYAESHFVATEGDVFDVLVGAAGLRNAPAGTAPVPPYDGAADFGGTALGDFTAPGNLASTAAGAITRAPFAAATTYGAGGRSDVNCNPGPSNGYVGRVEILAGP